MVSSVALERAAYLRGEQAQHHVFCIAAGSVAWRTRGRRVETFRGTVVEGEDASKCRLLYYNNDGLCYALGRRRYTVVDDAEADGGPQNTRARTGDMQDVHSKVTAGVGNVNICLLYTSPSPRDLSTSRMPSSA